MNGRRNPLVAALVGVGLFIAWNQFGGGGMRPSTTTPAAVFGGGAGRIELTFTVNQPARLVSGFSRWDEATGEESSVDGLETFEPGTHTRTIDVGPGTYIYLELGVPDATPGAEARWTISVDGRTAVEESDRLDEPLQSGYAFFLQAEADDVDQMRAWTR